MRSAALLLALLIFSKTVVGRDYQIGVLYWSKTIPCQVFMSRGVEAAADELNTNGPDQFHLLVRLAGDGPIGIEKQIRQMNELIDKGVDAIVVQPTDNAALAESLQRANDIGIPVVAYDQYISQGELASYITSDNYQAGYYNGEYIASLYAEQAEPIKLVLVEYARVSSTVERLDGFLDALDDAGRRFDVLRSYSAVEPVTGAVAGRAIVKDFPKAGTVDVVFTVNDGGGLSVVEELAKAGRDEIIVATIDGDPQSIKNIRARRLTHIDTAQFCGPMGSEAMRAAAKVLRGQHVSQQLLLPVYPITRETLQGYPGWGGPIPPSFKKPWPSKDADWYHEIKQID